MRTATELVKEIFDCQVPEASDITGHVYISFLLKHNSLVHKKDLIIICSGCRNIRLSYPDKSFEWVNPGEHFKNWIEKNYGRISHTLCRNCLTTLYPEIAEKIERKKHCI